jgi:DNA polymerase II large subunit
MHKIHEQRLRLSRVTAVFEDRALSFILAKGATLEDLSGRLADLTRHNGRPVAITVKFGTVKFGASSRKAGSHRSRRPGSGEASRDLV